MRNFKKFLTLVLAVMMVVSAMSFTTSAATTQFKDVDADDEALVNAIDLLSYMGITKGVSEDEFGTNQAVTREQFALFMYRLMKGGKDAPANASNTTKFVDLEDKTYFYSISWAASQNIVQGTSDTTFSPKNGITLQDAYTMVVRALDYEEENELIYPHGYIDIAESDGVELDKGLPSDLGYEDTLTRGQMAIILYNAFFAETAIPTVESRIVEDTDANGNTIYYVKEITSYDRLCEKHFDVKEVKYQAVATPHYTVSTEEATYDLGYDAIFFSYVYDDDTVSFDEVPANVYLEPETIGIEADEIDDYFLGTFTMFVVTNDDNDEIEKVLFANCDMTKKTVSDLKLGTVTTNKAASYFVDGESKLLSGKITTGTETIYAFNAPYTYAKPNYATGSSEVDKYLARNNKNISGIDYELISEGDVDYYVVDDDVDIIETGVDEDGDEAIDDEYFTAQAGELLAAFTEVYYGGLYEADIYDVDGDGIYDYIDYKPYMFFQVDSDEDHDFDDSDDLDDLDIDQIPYIYTNEATVIGAEFVDEDYVIGYVDVATKTVKIAEVIKPTVASISKIKKNSGSVVLSDGTPVNVGSAWKLVNNMKPAGYADDIVLEAQFNDVVLATANASGLLDAAMLDEDEVELYIYDGVVLYADEVDGNLKFTENLIIPLQVGENSPEKEFNKETGDRVWYIYAWVDGACKYIPVETEDVYPAIIDDGALTEEYNQQLCTYSVDADGIYTIKSLGFAENKVEDYKGVEKEDDTVLDSDEEDEQFIVVGAEDVTFTKKAGTRFSISGFDRDVVLKSYTKILVLTYDAVEDEYEMVEYDSTSFKASVENAFETATYLVGNNPDSKAKEDLVLFFATINADDFDFEAKKDKDGQRIVSLATPGVDENGYYRNYYDLFNPFTGAKEFDVAGNKSSSTSGSLDAALTTGTVVELKGGMVDEKKYVDDVDSDDYLGDIDTSDDESGLVWITEYDAGDDFITVVPVSATASADCKDCFEEAIETYTFDGENNFDGKEFLTAEGNDGLFFEITKDTAISVLKYSDAGASTTQWGTMTLGDISTIENANKEFKCYSDKVEDSKGNLTTKYAPYLMAYVSASEGDSDDDLPVADYIIIVVNKLTNGRENIFNSAKDAHIY